MNEPYVPTAEHPYNNVLIAFNDCAMYGVSPQGAMGVFMNASEVAMRDGIVRVFINDNGTFDILDFTLPSLGGRVSKNTPQRDVPDWITNAVAVLAVADVGTIIDDIGYKLSDRAYYLMDPDHKKGESNGEDSQGG